MEENRNKMRTINVFWKFSAKTTVKLFSFRVNSWWVNNQTTSCFIQTKLRSLALHTLSQTCCLFVRQMKQLIVKITIQMAIWHERRLAVSVFHEHTLTQTHAAKDSNGSLHTLLSPNVDQSQRTKTHNVNQSYWTTPAFGAVNWS